MSCKSTLTERKWLALGIYTFTANGTVKGVIKLNTTEHLRVKQTFELTSDIHQPITLEIKRIQDEQFIEVGPPGPIVARSDLTAYTVALNSKIKLEEQARPAIDYKEHTRAIYEEEPVIADRVVLVNKYGQIIDQEHPLSTTVGDGTEIIQVNPDGSINVNIVESTPGTPVSFIATNTFTNTTEKIVGDFVATLTNTQIYKITGEARTYGIWRVYLNPTIDMTKIKMMFRTSPTERNAFIEFRTAEAVAVGAHLIVTFEPERYRSSLLGASATTFVRYDGTSS